MSAGWRFRPSLCAQSRHRQISRRLRGVAALVVGLVALLLPAQSAFAEGSFDLDIGPGAALRSRLSAGGGASGPLQNAYTVLRAYARAGETIDMGSSAMGFGGSADILVYAPGTSFASATEPRTRAPLPADPVFGTHVYSCKESEPLNGRIASRGEEEAGPTPKSGGYIPCHYVAPADGVYSIVMLPYSLSGAPSGVSSVAGPITTTAQQTAISIWDVTVRNGTVEQPGRVFTNALEFFVPTAGGNVSNLSAFVYTPAGYVYHTTIFNPRSKAWDLAANGSGVVDAMTGEPISASFRWGPTVGYPATQEPTYGQALAPQLWEGDGAADSRYPLFFRSPDPLVISGPGGLGETRGYSATPMEPEGGLTSLLSFTGAGGEAGATPQGSGGTIAIDAPQLGGADYGVTLDLDRDGTFGGGGDVELAGNISGAGATSAAWDGLDSTGAVVPCGVSFQYQATSTLPAMHLVQSDTQLEAGTQIERLSLPADPLLGNPLSASYNDVDPYKGTAVTNAVPSAVSEGTSGPTFHAWSAQSGHAVFTDTWASGHPVDGTGTFEVACPAASPSTPGGTLPVAGPPAADSPPAAGSPEANPPGQPEKPRQTHKPKHHAPPKLPTRSKPPRLSLTLTAGTTRARPSSVVGYRITVSNVGGSAARDVEVCDEPAGGQRLLRTSPPATGEDEPCWTIPALAAGARRVLRLTAMVDPLAPAGTQSQSATATAANVKGIRQDRVAVRVVPLPERACGSSLARPLTGSSISFRC
jgi:uncharacterized repeat protein (TIGR01451 family)